MADKSTKSFYLSKTVWVNALTLVVGVAGYLAGHQLIADHASAVAALVAFQGAVNVALRFLTWQGVE